MGPHETLKDGDADIKEVHIQSTVLVLLHQALPGIIAPELVHVCQDTDDTACHLAVLQTSSTVIMTFLSTSAVESD